MLKPIKDLINFLNGFRKWSIMFLILVLGSVFLIKKLITGAEFVGLIVPTSLGFFGINGLEHMTNTVKKWLESKITGKGTSVGASDESN